MLSSRVLPPMNSVQVPDAETEVTEVPDRSDAFASLSTLLWSEREALELLLFKLVEEQLVVSVGATRWLSRADAEVQAAADRVRASEVLRATETEALGTELGLGGAVTLRELAEVSPEPWSEIFADHRMALAGLVHEVRAAAADNRRMLEAGSRAVAAMLDGVAPGPRTYGSRGGQLRPVDRPRLLDGRI